MNGSKTVLITGGAGFIGSHLCDRLLASGYHVICLDNFNDYYSPAVKEDNLKAALDHSRFTLVRGDILDEGLLEEVFGGALSGGSPSRPNIVVHLGALAGVRASLLSPGSYVDVDVRGTVNLLEAARRHEVQQFILGSSSSVYGTGPVPFSEDQEPVGLRSPYATAKRCAELYCETYNQLYGMSVTVLRFFSIYGPRQRPDLAIHKFVRLLRRGKVLPIYGDGSSARDYTYVGDVVKGIERAVEKPLGYQILNLGHDHPVELKELVDIVAKAVGVKPALEFKGEQAGDVPVTWASIDKAKDLLGYQPQVGLEEGLKAFLEWYQPREELLERE